MDKKLMRRPQRVSPAAPSRVQVPLTHVLRPQIRLYASAQIDLLVFLRIFLAGKKVMQIALGRSPADEAKTGLHKLSKFLQGASGLLFTNLPREDVERLFRECEANDFARIGSIAIETVLLLLSCSWSSF